MWRLRLIRVRLTLTYTLLLTGVFVLFSVGVFVTLHRVLYDNFYSRINAAADSVVKDARVSVSFLPNYGVRIRVDSQTVGGDQNSSSLKVGFVNAVGQILPGDNKSDPKLATNPAAKQLAEQAVSKGSRQSATLNTKGGDTNLLAVPVPTMAGPYVLLIQSSFQEVQNELDLLLQILIVSAVAVTVLSAGGAWFLTGRVLQPIAQITDTARQITVQDLSRRLNVDTRDEIGRMAATFNEMIGRLQASFERQKRFTSDASHELRTPLAVMQADLSLALRRPRSAEEYRLTLESAQEEVVRLAHIVSDLLMLARLDTDAAQIAHQQVDLHDLLDLVVSQLRPLATDRSIALSYVAYDALTVQGDQTRLKQVFMNLLDNAIAYTPDGGSVHIALTGRDGQAEVTVSDTGIGIRAEDLPHVFERFYRADDARARNHEGSGLGLAIAYKVVEAHLGTITVTSVHGQGTSFTVLIPLEGPFAGQGSTGRLNPLTLLAGSHAARLSPAARAETLPPRAAP